MPYIKPEKRFGLVLPDETEPDLDCAGTLNFAFTELILEYLDQHKESYQTYNDIIGALECCKLELYRRKIGKLENLKIKENGDVY